MHIKRNTQSPKVVSLLVQGPDSPLQEVFSFAEMPSVVRIGKSAIYDRLDPRSPRYDPTFPRPYKLGARARAVCFDAGEVRAWRQAQMKARDGGGL